jgi:tRNA-2-methylthio-N6-dimethylallyladenosine synthase
LIEGDSKRSDQHWYGRNSQNKVVVFPKENYAVGKGSYVLVAIEDATQATLLGSIHKIVD